MSNWTIVIEGFGECCDECTEACRGSVTDKQDRPSNVASMFVQYMQQAGHTIYHATVLTGDKRVDVVHPEASSSCCACEDGGMA